MLIVGKFMVSLEETSPLRFTLTQWHKTFGVLILLLAVFRLFWRLTHSSPKHPADAPAWERFAANVSHIAMYALLFIAPLTGWMLVSVSPLNIDTLLFNIVPWPHLPWLHDVVDKTSATARFAQFHVIATGALIALLLLHVGAALKHHFVNKDTVLTRISPNRQSGTGKTMFKMVATLVLGIGAAVFAYATMNATNSQLSASSSAVRAVASVMGVATDINFEESTVTASINKKTPEKSSLQALVTTASATSSNTQVASSLPDSDWFDSANHPTAEFESTEFKAAGDGAYNVTGTLTIKGIALPHSFELTLVEENGQNLAKGGFTVDRTAYQVGVLSQPGDDTVGNEVSINFEFKLGE